jgi:hypothetical protein
VKYTLVSHVKFSIYGVIVFSALLSACTPSQKITTSWVNREALPKGPYKKIFVVAITQNNSAKYIVEDQLSKLISSRGQKVVKANDIFPPGLRDSPTITKDLLVNAIKRTGCDAIFIVALMDVKTEERYHQGTYYDPMSHFDYYRSYYGYYSYRYPQVYEPGYYTTDKTYFLETNFYDVATDQLLWSIQSNAYNPSDLESMFKGYSSILLAQLKKEGLIKQ